MLRLLGALALIFSMNVSKAADAGMKPITPPPNVRSVLLYGKVCTELWPRGGWFVLNRMSCGAFPRPTNCADEARV